MQQLNLFLVGTITWIRFKSSSFSYPERKKLRDKQHCIASVWHIWKKLLRMLCNCVLVLCRERSSLVPSFGDQQEICLFYLPSTFYPGLHLDRGSRSPECIGHAQEAISVTVSSSVHWQMKTWMLPPKSLWHVDLNIAGKWHARV